MSERVETNQTSQQEQLAKGMAWLTAGNFISRLLGIVYVIPWYMWLGEHKEEANALFNMGYQVYANFLLISTVGLPTAVAKQIAKYNVLGKQETSFYLIREFFKLMLVLGAVFAGVMYLSSPLLATLSGAREELIPVMYSLVPPLFIFPAMSIMRGFFQGHHDMKPYAVSQIVEQIFRVIWILVATYGIMHLGSGNYLEAVTQSTFAAFVGMVASVAVLLYTLHKQGYLALIFRKKPTTVDIPIKSLIMETVKEAVPIIILGTAFQIFQFIDQITFSNVMQLVTDYSKTELLELYSYMVANPSKITMLIIGITGSIGSVAIPMITASFVKKDFQATADLITDNLQMLFIFIIPAIVGTGLLAGPLYTVFYGPTPSLAIHLFIANVLMIVIQGLYAVLGVVIQAIFENKKAILYFSIGLLVKCLLQVPAIMVFQVYGSLLSSAIGLAVTVYLIYRWVDKVVPLDKKKIIKDVVTISWISLVMGVAVLALELALNRFYPSTGYVSSALHIALSGFVGVAIFVALTLKTRQLDKLIGGRADALRRKLHIF